jgi:hypothetical protein
LAESLGQDVFREYWMTVPADSRLDHQQLEFACQRLLEADRPADAIRILNRVPFGKATVSPSIVMDALTACLKWEPSHPDMNATIRIVQELFGWLQRTIQCDNDEPTRRLAKLEWEFLSLLDGLGASPTTLIRCLSEDPKFFAQVIALIFGSQDERESGTKSGATRRNASDLYCLLMNWNHIPGTRADRSIDEEQLLRWLESARALCRESGNLDIADSQIGEMLARRRQPKDEATRWPCEEICDAIEEANSDDLDDGFQIGVLNSRGVTERSPLDGGDLERKERDKYRRWAALCDVDWPRTAASLRRVADTYESYAQREDARAAERSHERH